MDPNETFSAMMEAYRLGMYDEAKEHAEHLADWLNRDGFAPQFELAVGGQSFAVTDRLSHEICHAAFRLVRNQPEVGCHPEP